MYKGAVRVGLGGESRLHNERVKFVLEVGDVSLGKVPCNNWAGLVMTGAVMRVSRVGRHSTGRHCDLMDDVSGGFFFF